VPYRHPTSTLADVAGPVCALSPRIRQLVPGAGFVGRALPVLARDDDNGPVGRGILAAEPGDVLVVDGASSERVALLGGVWARRALERGVAAIVVDGCVRDLDELVELGLPVYAIGTTPVPPTKVGTAEPVDSVLCGGRDVRRGDVVTGDRDGVVVIAAAEWERVHALALEGAAREAETLAGIGPPMFARPAD
jgi:regulator of RNase E activity RraA